MLRAACLALLLVVVSVAYAKVEQTPKVDVRNNAQCQGLKVDNRREEIKHDMMVQHIELWQGIVLLVCFGAFALFICLIHRIIRTYVFYDAHLLDTFYDAGGDMNAGLAACAVVAKWTSTFSFTQPSNDSKTYGLVGTFWFSAALAIQMFLFSIVAAELRIKAPGTKTFLQAIRARLGVLAHVVIIIFALFINLMIVGLVMYEGVNILVALTEDLNEEVCAVIIAIVVAFFTVVGGVGGYIYVSYFVCALVMSIVIVYLTDFYFDDKREDNMYGDFEHIYNVTNCSLTNPKYTDNEDYSSLTFISRDAMMQGIVFILAAFSHMFVDQSFWQSAVSSRPGHGVWGFISGGIAWFAIPLALSFTLGMSFWVFSVEIGAGEQFLTTDDMRKGLLPVYTSRLLMGRIGDFMMFSLTMAVVISTVASQVLGASSIIMYDIYQTYISPFVPTPIPESKNATKHVKRAILNEEYMEYDKRSLIFKHVVVIALSSLTLPIGLIFLAIDVDAYWLFAFTGIIGGGCVLPITLAIAWHRITGPGVAVGAIVGFITSVAAWLIYASQYDEGLKEFRENTGRPEPLITGLAVGMGVGGVVCCIVSLACGGCDKNRLEEEEWEKCRKVDNPILPWSVKYAPDIGDKMALGRPHFYTVRRTFKRAEICAYIFGVLVAVLMILIWPALMLLVGEFSESNYEVWLYVVLIWTAVAGLYLVIVPFVWECIKVCSQAFYNRTWDQGRTHLLPEDDSISDGKSLPPAESIARTETPQLPPTPVATIPTPMPIDTRSESDFNSTMGRGNNEERWTTYIRLDE